FSISAARAPQVSGADARKNARKLNAVARGPRSARNVPTLERGAATRELAQYGLTATGRFHMTRRAREARSPVSARGTPPRRSRSSRVARFERDTLRWLGRQGNEANVAEQLPRPSERAGERHLEGSGSKTRSREQRWFRL